MTTIYYIKLEANLSARGVYYTACWSGKEFRIKDEPWGSLDNLKIAEVEFDKVLTTVKPEFWSGCYQIGIWAEVWQGDDLIQSGYVKTYQTPAFKLKT